MFDQHNQVQDVPDVPRLPAKKRKREDKTVEACPMKKRKKVDNGRHDAINMDGSILSESYRDLVRPSVLLSYTLPPPPPVDSSLPWTAPVPTTMGQVQILEPAPLSRLKSAGGTGKKKRCAFWHVWSKVCNCTLPSWDDERRLDFCARLAKNSANQRSISEVIRVVYTPPARVRVERANFWDTFWMALPRRTYSSHSSMYSNH